MCCICGNHTTSPTGDSVIVSLIAGIVAIIRAAWWLAGNVAAPLLAFVGMVAYRWTSGALMLPNRHRTEPPLFTRAVRATLRNVVTVDVIGGLINPFWTGIVTFTVVAAIVATAATIRIRAARRRRPRRVKVTAGAPIRTSTRRATVALTAERSDITWTEQSLRHDGRAA
jgi:hypothetical protein